MNSVIIDYFKKLFMDAWQISRHLFKIMIPIVIVVKILQETGGIALLGNLLAPVMHIVGLPGSMGLVWATTIVANIYTGIVVFLSLTAYEPLSAAQTTVLATMMLVAHNLPIELRIAQKAGARMRFMLLLRMGGALALGWMLCRSYEWGGWLQYQNAAKWMPQIEDSSLPIWAFSQVRGLAMIFLIISGLLLVLRIFDRLGINALMTRMLNPVLGLLGIGPAASPITIIGMTLGLGYGGGLIIQEVATGRIGRQDVLFSLTLMGLSHSLVEDTLAVAIMGAHFSGILWARVLFSMIVVYLLVKLISSFSERTLSIFFVRPTAAERAPN
ncbi:MAG: nucleoside recognition domain-containing protein [Syntrophobacteraceae bacterium]